MTSSLHRSRRASLVFVFVFAAAALPTFKSEVDTSLRMAAEKAPKK